MKARLRKADNLFTSVANELAFCESCDVGGNNNDEPVRSPANNLNAGDKVGVGQFTLVRRLSASGSSVVWLAQDEQMAESVALKFLPPEILADEIALDDLRRETAKCRELNDPRIIRIHDLIETPGETPFISMDHAEGANLTSLRLGQPQRCLDWETLTPLVAQLCEALIYAHGQNVMHRDLKPANLIVDSSGGLKIAEFGIASTINNSLSRLSPRDAATGMMVYMSPQQLNGEKPAVTDDIYSLGATLYELICSRPPFFGGDIPHQIRHVAAVPPVERLAELQLKNPVPGAVSALVMACLAKSAEQRPQSVHVIAEWLGCSVAENAPLPPVGSVTVAEELPPIDAPVVGHAEPVVVETPQEVAEPVESVAPVETAESTEFAEPAPIAKPRNRKLIVALVVFAILVVANGALFWFAREKHAADDGKTVVANDGWIKLFDGQSTAAWVGEDGSEFPVSSWRFDSDLLETIPNGGKVALFTREQFSDFELEFDWRMGAGGNSGILYGPRPSTQARREFQLVDDESLKQLGGKSFAPENHTGAFWGIIGPTPGTKPLPVGQWNHGKLIVNGTHVEHWVNGWKAVEYDMTNREVLKKFAAAKKKYAGTLKNADPEFMKPIEVAIGLQALSGNVAFRNIRLKKLTTDSKN